MVQLNNLNYFVRHPPSVNGLLFLTALLYQLLPVSGNLIRWAVLRPLLKPLTRILVGLIAIPLFRLVVKKGMRIAKVEEFAEDEGEPMEAPTPS